ncbi:DEAD/DEAH box helicase [candidate division KSB1 bacterium]|nr:DEAD/DEAH box helicase [candidate division KSB1 bacterium]
MTKIDRYISSSSASSMRESIRSANGNEVFFIGKTNSDHRVVDVKVVARGNEFAVPAVTQLANAGDVLIHNHPSGVLRPSQNDLYIAQDVSGFGIASYIVNNNVDDVYVIIEPFRKEDINSIDVAKLTKVLDADGEIAKKLSGYEFRPQQLDMVGVIGQAFNENRVAVIEAGTGVGKSLAYLIPAIFWAVKNKERCVVSTNTINLQEQLIKKDIPFLQDALDLKFKAVLVKGRYNYICLRKAEELKREPELMLEDNEQSEVQSLIAWSEQTADGSRSDLNYIPSESAWEKVAAESDTCTHSKCPFYKKCFVNIARREANSAHILVVNHHLLFSDLAVRSSGSEVAVLPAYRRVIFDEAHHLEEIATHYFGGGVTRMGVQRILSRLYRIRKGMGKGYLSVFVSELRKLKSRIQDPEVADVLHNLETQIIPGIAQLSDANDEAMDVVFNIVYMNKTDESGEMKLRIMEDIRKTPLWENVLQEKIHAYILYLNQFCRQLTRCLDQLEDTGISFSDELYGLIYTISAQCNRLQTVSTTLHQIVFQDEATNIRWIEIRPRAEKHVTRLRIAPLDISEKMFEHVYSKFPTVILTSATLTVTGIKNWQPFDYLAHRIGLTYIEKDRLLTSLLATPFNYQEQAIIGIPTDIPLPDSQAFAQFLDTFLLEAIGLSNGRAFVLFTSYRLMNSVYSKLEYTIKERGWIPLIQGSMNRHQLLKTFKDSNSAVLFGTDSFWEGVDVPGKALENVILTKLPFKVPTEPVIEARIEAITRNGGNSFMEYSLPQAVIKMKQGVGRLIRNKTDRGSIWILDKRLVEKFYGRVFIQSLPSCPVKTGATAQVLSDVKLFFNK